MSIFHICCCKICYQFFLTKTVEVTLFLGGVLSSIALRSSSARDPHGSASNLIYQFHNLSTLWRSRSLSLDSIVHVYNLGEFSQPKSTGLLVCALLSRHTQQVFVLPYNMSFTSASFYGVLLNDDFTLSYMDAINESPDPCSQTEGSWYYPTHAGEPAPSFPILFPTPTSILERTSSIESSTSLESTTTFCSDSSDDLHHSLDGEEGDHDAQPAAAMDNAENKGCNVTRRTRGPNRRRPGSAYSELIVRSFVSSCMMEFYMDSYTVTKDKLPTEVRDALNQNYHGCCEVVVKRDNSTMQKHRFSNRHCSNLPQELQALLPSFTCPAFVVMHSSCRSAKYVSSLVITQ